MNRWLRAAVKYSSNFFPQAAWAFQANKNKRMRLPHRAFILSFDCDTEKDIEVVPKVQEQLSAMGVLASYAVPGELLLKGRLTYKSVSQQGSEFINHGYLTHTVLDPHTQEYSSTLFYDQIRPEEVATDIRKGHETVASVIGIVPKGFRTPHFGTYQRTHHLEHLYATLSDLNYAFSSSTVPTFGIICGSAYSVANRLWEIPVSGASSAPANILDSWSYRFAPHRRHTPEEYVAELRKMVDQADLSSCPSLLNIYADPSQVHDWPEFFETIKYAAGKLPHYGLGQYASLLEQGRLL